MKNNIWTLDNIELTDTRELNEVPMEEITKTINEKIIPCLDSIRKSWNNTEIITPSIYNMGWIDSMIPEKLNEDELIVQDLENARKLKESILNCDNFS